MANLLYNGQSCKPRGINDNFKLYNPTKLSEPLNSATKKAHTRANLARSTVTEPLEYGLGDTKVRQVASSREKECLKWRKNLKDEIDQLQAACLCAKDCMTDILARIRHFENIQRISHQCWQYRRCIGNLDSEDELIQFFGQEICILKNSIEELAVFLEKLKGFIAEFERSEATVMKEADIKLMCNAKTLKAIQQAAPVNWTPCSLDMRKPPSCSEEEWDEEAKRLIKYVRTLRFNMLDCCTSAKDTMDEYTAEIAAAWTKTNYHLSEEIHLVEHAVEVARKNGHRMSQDIISAHLRLNLEKLEFDLRSRQRSVGLHRNQMLKRCYCNEHVCDEPISSIEDSIKEAEQRMDELVFVDFKRDEKLLADAIAMKQDQMQHLDEMSKRLYIDREKCLGLRRCIMLEGVRQNTKI